MNNRGKKYTYEERKDMMTFALALKAEGKTIAKIAKALNCSPDTVRCWLDPRYAIKRAAQIRNARYRRSIRNGEML